MGKTKNRREYTKLKQGDSTKPDNLNNRRCCRYSRIMKCSVVAVPLVLAVTIVLIARLVHAGPLHAQCNVDWKFGIPCKNVSMMVQLQIKKWSNASGCDSGGEKCLYTFKSLEGNELKATHTTPVKKYVDDLTFTFKSGSTSSQCSVHGYSTSEIWYAILDYGTNYCNLHNLITGSGLDKVPGYSEKTNDKICTQYSSADCSKY